ncbi:MAG: type II toxin-antitoxin system Phd/YefM family antitoxin [Kiritimatiellia bacterium]|jgi:prevent-host-death family protein|nr:type II toxin-antitoxin system Phd/YefM family antitoxin [Kiritimatiellia bacterium]
MRIVGIFEAKTHLSELCEQVAVTREPVTVTKRGKPLVRIDPVESDPMTIRERREIYMATHGGEERDDAVDFEPPKRSTDISSFEIED